MQQESLHLSTRIDEMQGKMEEKIKSIEIAKMKISNLFSNSSNEMMGGVSRSLQKDKGKDRQYTHSVVYAKPAVTKTIVQ